MGRPKTPLESKTWAQLVADLDDVFSYYIRLTNANDTGVCSCYTCGKKFFWKYIQNGHFMIRTVWPLRWNIDNCRPQCQPCNGNMDQRRLFDYEESLRDELGDERVDEMKGMRHVVKKWEKLELIAMIVDYEGKVKKMSMNIPQEI